VVSPFHVKVIGAIAEHSHMLDDDDFPPLFSHAITECVIVICSFMSLLMF